MKQRLLILLALLIVAGCNSFVPEQRTTAILATADHKHFSLTSEIDSGKIWSSFRILPRLGTKKTDIVLPELKDKPCNIFVSLQEVGSASPGNTWTETQYDFGKSHPNFALLKDKKYKVTINVVFGEAIQTNIMFDVILFAEPKMQLP